MDSRRLQFALAQLEGRLHKSVGDKRCGCGPCAHWVSLAARSAGISRARLQAKLPPPAKPERRRRGHMRARICDSATIRARGSRADSHQGWFAYAPASTRD